MLGEKFDDVKLQLQNVLKQALQVGHIWTLKPMIDLPVFKF